MFACAVARSSTDGLPSNYTDMMKGCCKSAPVESFASNCGLYCLSVGQSVADLNACFQSAGIYPGYIFCNGNLTATATGRPDSAKATGGAGPTSAAGQKGEGAMRQSMSKAGMGVVAMLMVSVVAGVFL
jgi:hypothetical protein